jgi:hypothetical protein
MPNVMPHLHYVSATEPTATQPSLTAALRHASAGDTVLVGPGHYSPTRTQETFPLYVPPGVTLLGAGREACVIDGEGALDVSFRPVREGQSLIVLGDGSAISGFTVTRSGGNGLSNQPGARVQIVENTIQQHGQHGILLSGPEEAIVQDNTFLDNGTKAYQPVTPRPAAARQGHHIFVQGKGGAANRMLISHNMMSRAFADAIALVVFFDEPDGVQMHVRIVQNTIEHSQRRGLTIAGSFGSCHNRVTIDVQHNTIRENASQAIGAQAGRPLVTQMLRDNRLRLRLIGNQCHNNGGGIMLCGGFGPAEDNCLDATIAHNHFTGPARHALSLIGGVGFGGYDAHRNRITAVISHNRIEDVQEEPIFLQGGVGEEDEEVTGNAVLAQVGPQEVTQQAEQPLVLLNDGVPGNTAILEEPQPAHRRVSDVIPYPS